MIKENNRRVHRRRNKKKKALYMFLSIALLLTLAVGGTVAYVVARTAAVENRFGPGSVSSSVNDNGQVTNNGNVDAYIRTAVVVNWMDANGNVYGIRPNYSISVNSNWKQIGDFYYYTDEVAPNATTATAPVTVSVSGNPPSAAYSLSVEIVAEALQADGETDSGNTPAYQDAWGISAIGD